MDQLLLNYIFLALGLLRCLLKLAQLLNRYLRNCQCLYKFMLLSMQIKKLISPFKYHARYFALDILYIFACYPHSIQFLYA